MVKITPSPDALAVLAKAIAKEKEAGADKRPEALPKAGKTEREHIRPARTRIAHQMGGNKGK